MAYAHAQGIRGVAFTIKFDYRFDTNGFFADPDARAALESAAALCAITLPLIELRPALKREFSGLENLHNIIEWRSYVG